MARFIYFVPSKALNAAENIRNFIEFVRNDIRCFPCVQWDSDSWNLSRYFSNRSHPNAEVTLAWRGLSTHTRKHGPVLAPPVSAFAKAYICYAHVLRPTANVPRKRLDPFKALDLALSLRASGDDLVFDTPLFNQAQGIIRQKWNSATAYRALKELEKIAKFIDDNYMSPARLNWRSSMRRPCDESWRVSKEATNIRLAKMPSGRALKACAEVFNLSVRPQDVLVASVVPLLMAGPCRIGEVMTLPIDAQVEEIFDGQVQFGLRWFPEKDGLKHVKWVLPSFAETVRKAFKNILRVTREARKMATWYTENKTLYLPEGLEHFRRQSILNAEELCLLVGLQGRPDSCARQWCSRRKINYLNNPFRVWFKDVELQVLADIPTGFPWRHRPTKLQYRDSLFVVPKHFFHNGNRPNSNVMFEAVTHGHINTALGGHEIHAKSSIFSRFGLLEEDGSPISINSHAFRHWLNTIAQKGGLSQLEIALWSGRKSVQQNAAYDHITADELLEKIKDTVPGNSVAGPVKPRVVSEQDISQIVSAGNSGAIHHTEIGICIHDYTLLPCQLHMDCINCHESICIKGDEKKTRHIVELRDKVRSSLNHAQESEKHEYFGADRWTKHQQLTLARLEKLVEILDDPSVPEGTVIQLNAENEWSPIKQACSERIEKDSELESLFPRPARQIDSST